MIPKMNLVRQRLIIADLYKIYFKKETAVQRM